MKSGKTAVTLIIWIDCFTCHLVEYLYNIWLDRAGWSVGSKPVGRNDVFTERPKYYHKPENRKAKMTIRPKNYITNIKKYLI